MTLPSPRVTSSTSASAAQTTSSSRISAEARTIFCARCVLLRDITSSASCSKLRNPAWLACASVAVVPSRRSVSGAMPHAQLLQHASTRLPARNSSALVRPSGWFGSFAHAAPRDAPRRQRFHDAVARPVGDDLAAVDHDHARHHRQQRGAVRHQHHRLVVRELADVLRDLRLGGEVHRAGGLVEQQDGRVVQHGARKADALALPARERLAALAHRHVEAARVAVDEVGHAGQLGRGHDGRVIGIGQAEGDVVAQRAVEERHVLRHVADVAPHVGRVELAQVDAVEQHRAVGRLVQAHDQPLDGRLARAHAADQRHALAGGDLEAQAVERRVLPVRVAELDVAELDVAAQLRALDEAFADRALDRLLHDLVERLHRRAGALVLHQQAHDLPGRPERAAGQHRRRRSARPWSARAGR